MSILFLSLSLSLSLSLLPFARSFHLSPQFHIFVIRASDLGFLSLGLGFWLWLWFEAWAMVEHVFVGFLCIHLAFLVEAMVLVEGLDFLFIRIF